MIGALWTGISGLSGQQTALDNESHNIANVNTIGYKASRISFADQLYQDKIGKGTKVLDAEKLFTQGNLKLTGVSYDLAISGNGFFSVKNDRASGTSETFFTRAGNFRMGDDGTLQDSAGNKVQGWAMSAIDTDADVLSTNPNINVFTTDYTKLVSSKVISHSNYVETITAKTTDYATSAEADSETIFSGAGLKSKSAKVADVEELVSNYTSWLQKYQDDPEGTSASSTSQVSQIKFDGSNLNSEGDQIYVYINGTKYTQSYVSVVATTDADGDGIAPSSSTAEQTQDNIAASKIATYKALADQLSGIPGLVAYTVKDGNSVGETQGVFESNDTFTKTTFDPDAAATAAPGATPQDYEALLGMIEIKGLIPGEAFEITEVATVSGTTTTQGVINTTGSNTEAVQGSGLGALESARDALAMAVSGNQRDVFTAADLDLNNSTAGESYNFNFTIYDKDIKDNVSTGAISLSGINTIDEAIAALEQGGTSPNANAASLFNKYYKAENINGNLVITTQDTYFDAEFSTTLTAASKSFASSFEVLSSGDEQLTYDKNFKPDPDSTKDYSATISYEQLFDTGTTGGTNVVVGTTDATTFGSATTYNLSLTFNDANDSLGRGGGNQTLEISVTGTYADEVALAAAINTELTTLGLNTEFTAAGVAGTSVTITSVDSEVISAVSLTEVISMGTNNLAAGTVTDMSDLASDLNTAFGAPVTFSVDTDGNLVATIDNDNGGGTVNFQSLNIQLTEGSRDEIIEKNADHSGRKGAGAEFLEIVNKIDQVASQGSLQLRLDTLGISDSAFGEFSVDNTGLITMKQDGAEFAIGQVSIALFNNTRGLEPYGDNLLAKTTNSGDPIYNVNNERTANIEGGTLELSTADLSESLVNLMVFQRAFEANAKTITTSDALLNTLINLKR